MENLSSWIFLCLSTLFKTQSSHTQFNSTNNREIWNTSEHAIAQHYGIPTRLLDWTENPLFAAFFAAENVQLQPNSDEKYLTVIALDKFLLGNRFIIVDVPRHQNSFIQAQSSVFTLQLEADKYFVDNDDYPSFEDIFFKEKVLEINGEDYYPVDGFFQIKLPHSEAGELLRLLHAEGISRSRLMPTYDNVTRSIKTWEYWFSKQN